MQNRLLCFTHNPPHKVYIKENLKELIKAIQIYCKSFYSFTLIGKYNAKVTETSMASFDEKYELKSFKNKITCYKKLSNPSCRDIFLTNNANSFKKIFVMELRMIFIKFDEASIFIVMKSYNPKQKPNII